MGANLSLLAPHAHTVATRSYVDVFSNYEFLEVVNNSRFLKTMKAYDRNSGMLVAMKIFIKPVQGEVDLHTITERLTQEALLLAQHPNVLAWHQIIETSSAGYLVRQLAKTSLYDRLSLRPFLAPIEKLWIVYQLLRVVELLHHDLLVCHGDIKTENILLTSANWLVLTDFAQNTKPVYLPDDNPSEFVFYFDSSNRRSCYVAPERFYSKVERASMLRNTLNWKLSESADMFSVGCVIAELYLDGEATFSLSDLYKYKRGEGSPNLLRIQEPQMRELVNDLLNLDADKRPTATEILTKQRGILFPTYFYDFLFDFMSELNGISRKYSEGNDENYSESDRKIDYVYDNYHKIATAFEFCYDDDSRTRISQNSNSYDDGFPHLKLGLLGIPKNYRFKTANQIKSQANGSGQQQGALMLLDTVFSFLGSVRRPRSKIRACEIILALSERIHDESKLDRSLPYICSLLEDSVLEASRHQDNSFLDPTDISSKCNFSAAVARVALLSMTNLLSTCSGINAINALVFPEFICPLLKSIAFLNSPFQEEVALLKCTLAHCFPYLANISQTFKSFLSEAPLEVGDAVTLKSDDLRGLFNSANVRVEPDIKDITEALLTDANVNVRLTLVNNILPLCQFFGVDKTNDVILPHLITYLNDSSYQLRLGFLSSILKIGHFIGVLSFEQYILPLLVQILSDHELFIVIKVLEIFNYFVKEKLINPATDFNAWSIYKDMLQSSILLLLQPNEWIRQHVIFLILAISDNLLNADRFCFLYPILKLYLSYDISVISWDTIYPSLTRPISKQVIETSLAWLLSSSTKSLFWKQTRISIFQQNGKRNLVSYTKDMGRSVYAGRLNSSFQSDESISSADIPLSFEDKQWVLKLKAVGLEEKELWKVFALKNYLVGSRSGPQGTMSSQREFELASSINISPKTIFFEICYKSEPINSKRRGTQVSVEVGAEPCNVSIVSRNDTFSLVLPNNGKAKASLQTHDANVFGELEIHHDDKQSTHKHLHNANANSETAHKIISTTDEKIISTTIRNNFKGSNPFILKFLKNVDFDPLIDDFPEFGQVLKGRREESINSKLSITGVQVASCNLNDNPKTIDPITKVTANSTSEIIVTGSRCGKLKIWDTAKLEASVTSNPGASADLGLCITDIVFMPYRWVFAVTTVDGYIRLFRIHVSRGKNRKIIKILKLFPVRKTKVESGYVTSLQFATTSSQVLCVAVTSECKIMAIDVIKMEKVFDFQNPLHYGIPKTFVTCKLCSWILVGTSEGVLCLWDTRFGLLLASYRVLLDGAENQRTEIHNLVTVSTPINRKKSAGNTYFAMTGGTEELDIIIWEMPSFVCRQYFSAHQENPKIKNYTLRKLEPFGNLSVDDILADLSLDFNRQTSVQAQTLYFIGGSSAAEDEHLILVTGEQRVTIWNWRDVSKSVLLFSEHHATFTLNAISPSLTVVYERLTNEAVDSENRGPQDKQLIADVCFASKPTPMMILVRDDGHMEVYK